MYDMLTGPFNGNEWRGQQFGPMIYHHDWSRATFTAAFNYTAEMPVFDYAKGANTSAAFAAVIAIVPAARPTFTDTSLSKANQPSQACVITHLGVQIEIRARGGAIANDTVLATEADYRMLLHRMRYSFFWKENTLREAMGHIDEFPCGKGQDHFSQRANEFQANNGAPVWSNLRPARRPMRCERDTFILGNFTPEENGGCTPAAFSSIMADFYGINTEPELT